LGEHASSGGETKATSLVAAEWTRPVDQRVKKSSSVGAFFFVFCVYIALTNIPEGELLTGFAMRSDPNVVFR